MARLALKPDASFFKKIAIGAVGARAVSADLAQYGHEMVELERGSTDTKLWKDVKRKRVRIPDLVCTKCGCRVESRAKTKADLSMSHSPTEESRAWDFGMVDLDMIAFPVCQPVEEAYWSANKLGVDVSYWHERNWIRWHTLPWINYFTVSSFRNTPHSRSSTKGVTEGSETSVAWDATFSTRSGTVDSVAEQRVTIRRAADNHRYTWRIKTGSQIVVSTGDSVEVNQLIAAAVRPVSRSDLKCTAALQSSLLDRLLTSRERTQRYTGVKLARLRKDPEHQDAVTGLVTDPEEDIYIRLEGASYLVSLCSQDATALFGPHLNSPDPQTQLETVIALGETEAPDALSMLIGVLGDPKRPYFLRSAAAWCLGRRSETRAAERLIEAFSDIDPDIREVALEGLVSIGGPAVPLLIAGLCHANNDLAAGCAEALRQLQPIPKETVHRIVEMIDDDSQWAVWLLGTLPRDSVAGAIAQLQDKAPKLHYAITVLWSFAESWISGRWEFEPTAQFPTSGA